MMRDWRAAENYTCRMILGSELGSEWLNLPFTAAHVALALALLFYLFWFFSPGRALRMLWLLALAAHGAALALQWLPAHEAGHLRFGFAPALAVIAWFSLLVVALETRLRAGLMQRRALSLWGALSVLLALLFPGAPLVGTQANHFAAHLHWLLGLAAYGLFAVAVLHAAAMQSAEERLRHHQPSTEGEVWPLLKWERLTFRFLFAGFVLLTLALALGFALPFQWSDEKILLALCGWLVFAALLVARHLFGVRGVSAARVIYAGAALLLLAYIGSRIFRELAP